MCLWPSRDNENQRRPRASGDPLPVDSRLRGNDVTFRRVKESRSWESNNRRPHLSGCDLGRRWGRSWNFRLVDLRAPELGERVGGQDSEKTQNITNEANMLLKTNEVIWKRS
jgi:hypothetical protein